jgi:thiamine biosynthesis lipoprotein
MPRLGVRRAEPQWGTVISVDVRDPVDDDVLDELFAWFRRVDDLFSTWRPETEISRIARGDLELRDADQEVRSVLATCAELKRETNGAFDVEVARGVSPLQPGQAAVDPSGYVKGWAVEEGACHLRLAGVQNFSIGAGGDVVVRGRPDPSDTESVWRVGLAHPWDPTCVAMVLGLADYACATSGRYERGDHLLDPRNGTAATGLVAATVIGPDLGVADAYATALMVLGAEEGLRWIETKAAYDAVVITPDRSVVLTPGLERVRLS